MLFFVLNIHELLCFCFGLDDILSELAVFELHSVWLSASIAEVVKYICQSFMMKFKGV